MNKEDNRKKSGLMAKAEAINEALAEEKMEENSPKSPKAQKAQPSQKPHKVRRQKEHSGINRILTKIIIILILLCSLVGGGLFAIRYFKNSFFSPAPVVVEKKSILVEDQLLFCQELVSTKYKYSDIVASKKPAKINKFAMSYYIIKYSGIIRFGIADMSKCTYEISEDGKTLVLTLPPVEVLGNDITSQEVFDEHNSMFVPITIEEVFNDIKNRQDEFLEEILSEGILEESRTYVKNVVKQFLLSVGYEDVIVL